MEKNYNIAGYCRISVDEELDRDNTSIENQKNLASDSNNVLLPFPNKYIQPSMIVYSPL